MRFRVQKSKISNMKKFSLKEILKNLFFIPFSSIEFYAEFENVVYFFPVKNPVWVLIP
jgi:hypothetical protein